jgi:hypothetical protein
VTGVHGTTMPPTTDWAKAAPNLGAQACKHPCIAARCSVYNCHAIEVITHIELPPYHWPHSPLDLVPSEIVFGHIFEAFH